MVLAGRWLMRAPLLLAAQAPKLLACSLHPTSQPAPTNCTIPGAVITQFGNSLSVSVSLAGRELTNVAEDLLVYYGAASCCHCSVSG